MPSENEEDWKSGLTDEGRGATDGRGEEAGGQQDVGSLKRRVYNTLMARDSTGEANNIRTNQTWPQKQQRPPARR